MEHNDVWEQIIAHKVLFNLNETPRKYRIIEINKQDFEQALKNSNVSLCLPPEVVKKKWKNIDYINFWGMRINLV